MTRELRVSARRVARPSTASCADAHGELRDAARTVDVHGATVDLAARQAELVAALVASGPLPSGFDPDRLAVARRALLRKRAGEAATVWPLLAASLGQAWPDAFAASVAGRAPLGALRDGWDLARELSRRGDWATPPPSSSPSARCPSDIATAGRDACPRSAGARMAQSCRSAAGYTTSRVVDVAHPTFPDARTVGVAS